MPGGLRCVVLYFQVLLKSVQWFCRCGWSKIALPHYFGHCLIQQLVLPYRTSRDYSQWDQHTYVHAFIWWRHTKWIPVSTFGHVVIVLHLPIKYGAYITGCAFAPALCYRRPAKSMGDREFWPLTESKPMSRLQQNSAQLITSEREPTKPNLVQIHPLGASGHMGEI